ncbi:hypothetical protein [Aquibacillus salsiterrae]|uniref:ABC transporter permease n=1 Tax=Aquibacillus salsiterrae TaxID=2950439 RepID=A0A9X3WK59_9BACI|nr:hypothetical protein [Aquibacillus salsiterrae]MDC3418576.1 hypothetical protein [Aquibacillus salsiterrae]
MPSYGSVLGDLETFFSDNESMKRFLRPVDGVSLLERFIPMLMIVISLLATVPPIMAINKLHGEEKKERIVHLLGRSISRTKLLGSYFILSVVNGLVMLALAAFGLWSVGTTVVEGGLSAEIIFGAGFSYYPAMLVMLSLAVLLIGLYPLFGFMFCIPLSCCI